MSHIIGRSITRPVMEADVQTRAAFVSRVYTHLLGAIAAFTAIEIALFRTGAAAEIARVMMGGNWLLVLGGFMIVGWLASRTAHLAASPAAQYLALAGFVAAEAVMFVPLLFIANHYAPGAIQSAAVVTLGGFAALTGVALVTRKDFSFLRGIVVWGFVCAGLACVGGLIFGFGLGTWFSVAMIALAGASVLYDTSNVLHHFPEDRHVAASLELFSSIAVMFWYVLRLFLANRD